MTTNKKQAPVAQSLRVFIWPPFDSPDNGEGGIRRVVEAQKKYLPSFGVEVVNSLEQADLVATHGGVELKVPTDLPLIHHCHGLYWQEYAWENWAHKLNREVIKNMHAADEVTAPSKWVARALQRGMLIPAPVLYHGVDAGEWESGGGRDDAIEYVLWNKNRIDSVCDPTPVNELARMAPDVRFLTTFSDPAAEITPNIKVTGSRPFDEAKQFIKDASVYLCTTRETFGIGTLEAMAAGVPILGWDWGGQREIVVHKKHGWLAKPGDFNDLLNGLRYCLENRERLGKSARAEVLQKWTWRQAIEKYAALYQRVREDFVRSRAAPKVSVVITCYNLAEVLPRAVASVQEQSGAGDGDVEIVIVNDASPDKTKEVAERLAASDSRITVVNNSENLYLAGALNAGISAARGRYIVPLDADNELAPDALLTLANALDDGVMLNTTVPGRPQTADPRDIDIVYGSMELVEPDGRRWTSQWPGQFDFHAQMMHRNQLPSTSMFRRRVWSRSGGYRRRCRTAEDADFWTRATSFGAVPMKVTEDVTLIYHNRADSMSRVEKDWDWAAWYPWARKPELTPFSAPRGLMQIPVPTHEPARVTVIIPVGPGHGKYLQDAIDSVIAQTYTKWDIIVVNDSGEPLPDGLPPFIIYADTHEPTPVGPSVARNEAVKLVTTPLWLPLDADDYLDPYALEYMIAAWQPGHYVYSGWYVAETGEAYEPEEYDCAALLQKLPHSVTCLYERSAWEQVGGFDWKLNAWEDWDFVIALAAAGYCGTRIPNPLFYYRKSSGSRRESMYARKDQLKLEIHAKWREYIDGEKEMPCGACAKQSPTPPVVVVANNGVASAENMQDMVMVEYIGKEPPRTWRGYSTGTLYRFGNASGHKIKYIWKADSDTFVARENEFRLANGVVEQAPRLVAAGPPER